MVFIWASTCWWWAGANWKVSANAIGVYMTLVDGREWVVCGVYNQSVKTPRAATWPEPGHHHHPFERRYTSTCQVSCHSSIVCSWSVRARGAAAAALIDSCATHRHFSRDPSRPRVTDWREGPHTKLDQWITCCACNVEDMIPSDAWQLTPRVADDVDLRVPLNHALVIAVLSLPAIIATAVSSRLSWGHVPPPTSDVSHNVWGPPRNSLRLT